MLWNHRDVRGLFHPVFLQEISCDRNHGDKQQSKEVKRRYTQGSYDGGCMTVYRTPKEFYQE